MGEEIAAASHGDAYIQGLKSAVQFLLEDLYDRNENTIIVSCQEDITEWINGSKETSWEGRFLRNKVWSKRRVFNDVQIVYKPESEFNAKEQWEDIAINRGDRWIHWGNSLGSNDCGGQGSQTKQDELQVPHSKSTSTITKKSKTNIRRSNVEHVQANWEVMAFSSKDVSNGIPFTKSMIPSHILDTGSKEIDVSDQRIARVMEAVCRSYLQAFDHAPQFCIGDRAASNIAREASDIMTQVVSKDAFHK
ncbi:hypothetical protein PIB30_055446 [Stylosanthes scabra]|uniref:Uncharacterized protein n=1 Tax=Stylosanthes scabra TaxID=79078 RepID=A0ABU6VHJ0_9FABA|nr:hypothetical protein [Stylosanthes scabra]